MSRADCMRALLISALVLLLPSIANAATVADDAVNAKVEQALNQLRSFDVTHAAADIGDAILSMQTALNINDMTVEGFTFERRRLAFGYATLLKHIEGAYDASYNPMDPKNVYYVPCAPPPPDYHGGVPCPSLQEIRDPKVRAEYAEAIRKNDENRVRGNIYAMWRNVDGLATTTAEMSLESLRQHQPCSVSDDNDALLAVFANAELNQEHLSRIEKALQTPRPQGRHLRLIDGEPHLALCVCPDS